MNFKYIKKLTSLLFGKGSTLSREAILKEIAKGNIVFNGLDSQIQNQSIDVSTGKYIFIKKGNDFIKKDITKPTLIKKGTFFLAYTNEFVGTVIGSNIHCQFQQTSTSARLGLFHPKAGWGDVGYTNRWAMEFFATSDILIQEGSIVGQVTFTYTTETNEDYSKKGQYQKGNDLKYIKENWGPETILPRKGLKNIKNYIK